MSDIANISFAIDSAPLTALDLALQNIAKTTAGADAALQRFAATSAAAFAKVPAAFTNAQTGIAGALGSTTSAVAAQATSQTGLAAATGAANAAIGAQSTALGMATKAHQSHGAAAQKTALAVQELTHVGRALFDEMAAGGNVFRALAMEGGRLQIAFTQGGLLGSMGGLAARAASMINPFVLGGVALTGMGAAAVYAAASYRSMSEELDHAVLGAGRLSGLTGQRLGALAASGTAGTPGSVLGNGLGIGDNRHLVEAFARTGRMDSANIAAGLGAVRGYAGAFGTSYSEAGEKLADIFSDPAKGADELNKRLGFLDDRTRTYIRSLQAQGDQQGAVKALIDASSVSLNEQTQKLGILGQIWQNVGQDAAHFRDTLGHALSPPTDIEAYASASRSPSARVGQGRGTLGLLRDDGTADFAENIRNATLLAAARQNSVVANQQSITGGNIVRSVLPDIDRFQTLGDQQKGLSAAISNPDALKNMGVTADQAQDALSRLTVGLATFKTSAQQAAEQSALTIAGIKATSFVEKSAIEFQKNYLAALERTHSVLEATAEAEAKRNQAVATATRSAVDSAVPGLSQRIRMSDDIGLLRDALARPGAPGSVSQAYSNDIVKQSLADPTLQQRQGYDLSIASINAFSIGEKAIVEARRSELEVLRQTGDLARAATAAQMSMNEAIAKGNIDAQDRAISARQELGLVGLSPYQRARQTVVNQYEGERGIFAKDDIGQTNVSKGFGLIASDLGGATLKVKLAFDDIPIHFDKVVTALDGLAGRLASGGGANPYGDLSGVSFGGAARATPEMIVAAAARTGVPAPIIAAIGQVENGGRLTGGTSMLGSNGKPSSAWGFGQLTNGAAADVAAVVPGFNKYNPDTAVFGSAEYLSILAKRNNGDLTKALNRYGGDPNYASKIARAAGGGSLAPIKSTMLGSDRSAFADTLAAVDKQFTSPDTSLFGTPLGSASLDLKNQSALLATQKDTYGQMAYSIRGAAEAQQLWNKYVSEGVAPAGELSKQVGPLADAVRRYGQDAAGVAKQQQDFQNQQQFMQSVGSDVSNVLSSGLIGAASGQGFAKSAKSALFGVGENLIRQGVSGLVGGIFGGNKNGGGLLGSLFGSILPHFAGGTPDAPGGVSLVGEKGPELVRLPAHAQVIPHDALMAMKQTAGHTFNLGDTNILVQGNADDRALAQMRQEVAMSEQRQQQWIVRNLPQINADSQQTS